MNLPKKKMYYQNAQPILVAVDCIIFGFDQDRLKLLLFKRRVEPFRNKWSLIGSFVRKNEAVNDAARRILEESTGIHGIYLTELEVFSAPQRDPGGRVISIGHFALMRLNDYVSLSFSH